MCSLPDGQTDRAGPGPRAPAVGRHGYAADERTRGDGRPSARREGRTQGECEGNEGAPGELVRHIRGVPPERAMAPATLERTELGGKGRSADVYAWGEGRVLKLFR